MAAPKVVLALPMVALVAVTGFLAVRRAGTGPEPRSADPLAESWRRVSQRPQSPSAWVELAEVQAALDQAAAAERSLWTAIELGEPTGLAHGRLGFLLYAQHRDDEALPLLELAEELGADLPLLEHTVAQLRERRERRRSPPIDPVEPDEPQAPAVSDPASVDPGVSASDMDAGAPEAGVEERVDEPVSVSAEGLPCSIPLRRAGSGGTWLLEAEIEGEPVSLVVDTGASLTVITRELAADLALEPDETRVITAITANGRVEMPTAVLADTTVAGRSVRELRVAICADCVSGFADGLLGLDLQTSLRMQIDAAAGALRMGDCAPP